LRRLDGDPGRALAQLVVDVIDGRTYDVDDLLAVGSDVGTPFGVA